MAEKIIDNTCIRKGLKKRLTVTQANKLISKCAKKKIKKMMKLRTFNGKRYAYRTTVKTKKEAESLKKHYKPKILTRIIKVKHGYDIYNYRKRRRR